MPSTFATSLLAGAAAGTAVDLSLFPLDTLKTRLQAKGGFFANGGWSGVYKGIGSVVAGSAPSAALFFVTYEESKKVFTPIFTSYPAIAHMISASIAETAACAVRVPTEIIKQRAQASQFASSLEAFRAVLASPEGMFGLYRGWGSTLFREIPFTIIQFPIYEAAKSWRAKATGREKVSAGEAAVIGSMAGGFAAACTTPFDVIKTRLMLAKEKHGIFEMAGKIMKEEGPEAFLKGIGPRVTWISIGGSIFLGVYEAVKDALSTA
ncbi:S-adenosylmethionine transporter [Saitoella coloradoensis]